jgi:hypothetical protein
MRKTVDYYNTKIEKHKAAIKRLNAEKRIAILRQREREFELQANQAAQGEQA